MVAHGVALLGYGNTELVTEVVGNILGRWGDLLVEFWWWLQWVDVVYVFGIDESVH